MKPDKKQVQDPRETDPAYAEAMAETEAQRDAIIEEMYHEHIKETRRQEEESKNRPF
jgi:hypothetical protein